MTDPATTGAAPTSPRRAVREATGEALAPGEEDVVGAWTEHHQRMQRRARHVSSLVLELWGDAPPPGTDPAVTAAKDAVAADDGMGRAAHLVVQGDGVTYQHLSRVLALIEDPDHLAQALTVLPPRLRRRLVGTGCLGAAPGPAEPGP